MGSAVSLETLLDSELPSQPFVLSRGSLLGGRPGRLPCQMTCQLRSDMIVWRGAKMRAWNAVIERDAQTGLYVGYVPGWPGAHSQGETIDELKDNLAEVISMLLEDGEPALESEFVGTQTLRVG